MSHGKRRNGLCVVVLCATALLTACTSSLPGDSRSLTNVVGQASDSKTMDAQTAVDAVFRKASEDPTFQPFPRQIGSKEGVINIGGPMPGQTIPATFDTAASALQEGSFAVRLVRRWKQDEKVELKTTWTFQVDPGGLVHDYVRSGEEPPQIP